MIIDAHIHYTLPSLAEYLVEFSERGPYWVLLITPNPINHTKQGWATFKRAIFDR